LGGAPLDSDDIPLYPNRFSVLTELKVKVSGASEDKLLCSSCGLRSQPRVLGVILRFIDSTGYEFRILGMTL